MQDPVLREQAFSFTELMQGVEGTAYDVRRNMDRLPDFANPESTGHLTDKLRGRLLHWSEKRLRERMT